MDNARGMTLVEVVVALLILTTGLLAAAAGATTSARLLAEGRRATALAAAATAVLEDFRAMDCGVATGGTRTVGEVVLRWTVARTGAVVEITLDAEEPVPTGIRRWRFVLGRWCG